MTNVNPKRVRILKAGDQGAGPVVYWMSRDQRVDDNWALLYAKERALERGAPLVVAFCLVSEFLDAAFRHYAFMLRGLSSVEERLLERGIGFALLTGPGNPAVPRTDLRRAPRRRLLSPPHQPPMERGRCSEDSRAVPRG